MRKLDNKGIAHLFLLLLIVVLVAVTGTYLYVRSKAAPSQNAAQGQAMAGLKKASSGPCAGEYEVPLESSKGQTTACVHTDPGPAGVDLQARSKNIVSIGQSMVDADKQDQTLTDTGSSPDSNPDPTIKTAADVSYSGSLSGAPSVNWPCMGTGSDGYRTLFIYMYPSDQMSSRLSTLRSSFNSDARHMEGIMYYSSGPSTRSPYSGEHRKIRFYTGAPYTNSTGGTSCTLTIATLGYPSSTLTTYNGIFQDLKNSGYTSSYRRYVVEVDQASSDCGIGSYIDDTTASATYNRNNWYPGYAVTWNSCWHYAEPHELMHTLGSVLSEAPYSTGTYGHCWDQHDVMCYTDKSGHAMWIRCPNVTKYTSTGAIDQWTSWNMWRYDCAHDTYFNSSNSVSGWLGSYWNTANSPYLYRY